MIDVVIELMAEVSKQFSGDEIHPFKEKIGEILLSNLERNFW